MMIRRPTFKSMFAAVFLLLIMPAFGSAAEIVITETEESITVEYTGSSGAPPPAVKNDGETKVEDKVNGVQAASPPASIENAAKASERRAQRPSRQRPPRVRDGDD